MQKLTRQFEVDAGHRLCKHEFECQNLHGHRYQFKVSVEGDVDSDSGMVVDFSDVKSPIVEAFDHNLILNKNDPILTARELLEDHQQKEFYLIDGEPTAENIAEKALDIILSFLPEDDRRRIQRITLELKETPNSKVTTERVIDNER